MDSWIDNEKRLRDLRNAFDQAIAADLNITGIPPVKHKPMFESESDNVNHPKHYETYIKGLEAIDIIYAALGPEKFVGYCRGNALKYLLRADAKNGVEDLEKAAVYLDWEINIRKERNTTNEKAIKLRRL